MKKLLLTFGICLLALSSFASTDDVRFRALAMLESGNSDTRRGRAGEVSRYQILPSVWFQYSGSCRWTSPMMARSVAVKVMAQRVAAFKKAYGKLPTHFEWALLWHCPGHVGAPTPADSDYAIRFTNLLEKFQKEQ